MVRWRFEPVSRNPGWPLWSYGLLAAWLGLVAAWESLELPGRARETLCHFRRLTGVSCPTCGSTRMVLALLQGRVQDAAGQNPFVFALAAGLGIWLVLRVGLGRRLEVRLQPWQRRAVWAIADALFILNWAYVILYR
ncbi:MAG: DUF2752 domain-containing protein [Planctomycetes bacterium]|nr:DUF2752 domain-containing protein [Planctomycetota bacterium]